MIRFDYSNHYHERQADDHVGTATRNILVTDINSSGKITTAMSEALATKLLYLAKHTH